MGKQEEYYKKKKQNSGQIYVEAHRMLSTANPIHKVLVDPAKIDIGVFKNSAIRFSHHRRGQIVLLCFYLDDETPDYEPTDLDFSMNPWREP